MKSGNGVKINTTSKIEEGGTEGLSQTLSAYEEFDMNMLNDPTGEHPKYDGSGIGKSLRGSGKKP
jgi:hypothetical protein